MTQGTRSILNNLDELVDDNQCCSTVVGAWFEAISEGLLDAAQVEKRYVGNFMFHVITPK